MAGLGLALLGGALKGWGEGQMAEAKAQREEKLHLLDQQFTAGENALNRGLQREQIGSTERLAEAQRKSNEMLTGLEIGSREKIATEAQTGETNRLNLSLAAQQDIAKQGNLSRETIAELERKTQENIANLQTSSAQKIAKLQSDTQKDLDIKMVPMADGTWKMLRAGVWSDLPNDPATGKPLNPMATDSDTQEMKNYKYLISIGVTPKSAARVFTSKGADPTVLKASIMDAYLKAFGNKDEAAKYADDAYNRLVSSEDEMTPTTPGGTPASPQSSTDTTTAPDQSSTVPAAPKTPLTPEQRADTISKAKAAVAVKGRDAVVKMLQSVGITAAEAGI